MQNKDSNYLLNKTVREKTTLADLNESGWMSFRSTKWRRLGFWSKMILRVLTTGLLLVGLTYYANLDWPGIARQIQEIRLIPMLFGFLGLAASHCLSVASLRLLLRWRGFSISFGGLFANHLRGLFANQFLPTPIAGDLVRFVDLQHRDAESNNENAASISQELPDVTEQHETDHPSDWQESTWRSIGIALMFHRVLNLFVLLSVFVAAAWWAIDVEFARSRNAAVSLLLLGGFLVGLIAVSRLPLVQRRLPALVAKILVARMLNRRQLIQLLGLSLLQQFAMAFFVGSIAYGLSISVTVPVLLTMVSLSLLAVVLPISVNGLGVRDSVYVQVLAVCDVPSSSAVALSLSVFLIGFLFSLLSLLTSGNIASHPSGKQ